MRAIRIDQNYHIAKGNKTLCDIKLQPKTFKETVSFKVTCLKCATEGLIETLSSELDDIWSEGVDKKMNDRRDLLNSVQQLIGNK